MTKCFMGTCPKCNLKTLIIFDDDSEICTNNECGYKKNSNGKPILSNHSK